MTNLTLRRFKEDLLNAFKERRWTIVDATIERGALKVKAADESQYMVLKVDMPVASNDRFDLMGAYLMDAHINATSALYGNTIFTCSKIVLKDGKGADCVITSAA